MIALILGAVRARRAQAATVLLLTAIAAVVAAAAPGYARSAATRAAASDVAAAPASQRTVSVRKIVALDGNPRRALDIFAESVKAGLPVPADRPVLGMIQAVRIKNTQAITAAYRDGFCEHVRVTGACPRKAGEVALSRSSAQQLAVKPGDRVQLSATLGTGPIPLRVTGTYELVEADGVYWSNRLFRTDGGLDPAFVSLATFEERDLQGPTLSLDTEVPESVLRGDSGGDLAAAMRAADVALGRDEMRLVNASADLLGTIERDRDTVQDGVRLGTAEVLVLAWFAIGLTGRYTGRERRGDAALLKLRGSTGGGMLRLILGQNAAPMLAGAVLGVLAGLVFSPSDRWLSLASVGVFVAGGLLVLVAVEASTLRRPVADLLRQVPSGRRDWRADVVDLALVAVAVAAIYQARTGGVDSGLGLAAPPLIALAVALLLARLLGRVADRVGVASLRSGRLRFGLTALQLSRQPGTDRVFALVVVAVALLSTAAGGWHGSRTAATDRSQVQLGADRVLTVQALSRTDLLHAVRTADPGGRVAMAAVIDRVSVPPVLAVDSARLAAVAAWRPEYGPVHDLADPPAPGDITGDPLTIRVRNGGSTPAGLTVVLQNETNGAPVPITFGPFGAGDHDATKPVGDACREGCRLVRLRLGEKSRIGTALTITSLAQGGRERGALGDITRWRSDVEGSGAEVSPETSGLTLAVEKDPEANSLGTSAYALDTPLPLPVVLAGPHPADWRFTDPGVVAFGNGQTPVRIAATARVLPVLGGSGLMVDLDASRRVAADADLGGVFQVWLAPDAPASIVDKLTAAGLTVSRDDTAAAGVDRLDRQGPASVARFGLLAGLAVLLIAAAAVAVAAAVDRGAQAEQFEALRRQGLSRRVMGAGGLGVLVAAGVAGGLLAAAIARPLAGVVVAPFTDGWRVIPPPGALGLTALLGSGLCALILLGAVAAWSARRLRKSVR